jgi:DNA-binding IclR family transcriptional regulator
VATLSDIADAFNMPMSTAHIHLATLVESGYVIKEDCEYQCGLLCLRTGRELRDRMELFQAAKAEIDDLQERLGENANVGTIENGYMVQLYKSEDPESIDDNAPLGDHLYLHSTATGKAMFASSTTSRSTGSSNAQSCRSRRLQPSRHRKNSNRSSPKLVSGGTPSTVGSTSRGVRAVTVQLC